MTQIQTKILSNGIKCLYYPQPKPIFLIHIFAKAGSKYDPAGKDGLAHMVEHLIVSGSTDYPQPQQLRNLIAANGGQTDIYTTRKIVKFEIKTTTDNIEDSFKYLNQVIFHPLINQNCLDREKKIVAQENSSRELDKNIIFWEQLEKVIWPNDWRSRNTGGDKESVNKLTVDDAVQFHAKHYRPQDLQIVISGGYKQEIISSYLDKYFLNI